MMAADHGKSRRNSSTVVSAEKVEKVVSVGETLQAPFDDAEERVQGAKVFNVRNQRHSSLWWALVMGAAADAATGRH